MTDVGVIVVSVVVAVVVDPNNCTIMTVMIRGSGMDEHTFIIIGSNTSNKGLVVWLL